MEFENTPTPTVATDEVAWSTIKARIIAGLNVEKEYEALGLKFIGEPGGNARGVRECHAIGRVDAVASACVSIRTGVYHDSGGEGVSLSLFDFALKHGELGRWIDVIRHYADKAGVDVSGVKPGKGGRVREATYLYHDRSGAIRYAVFRYRLPNGKKSFSQHPPDGRGGWLYGAGAMDGVSPLPYRLPQLLASAEQDDPVFIVEGERDADLLHALGLTATTNHQGAASTDQTWPHFVNHFAGRECVVIPDNDANGKRHAAKVADYLSPVAKSVKVVTLPGLPLKGDVSDWLDLGHDLDELGKLAAAAPEWIPGGSVGTESADSDPDRDATVADLRAVQSAESWLWRGWIPAAALTLLAAEPGVGKTRFLFDLHRRIIQGLSWPDGSPQTLPRDSRVLWIAADGQWQELLEIGAAFGIPDEAMVLNAPASDPFAGTTLETKEDFADLEARIKRNRPVMVAIDTITNTGDFKTQDSSDAKKQYKPLQELAVRTATPIICVTHLNASGRVLGRRAEEKVRVVIQLACPDPEDQPNRRKLWVSKSKAIRPAACGVTMGDSGNEYDGAPPAPAADRPRGGAKPGPAPAKTQECLHWIKLILSQGRMRVSALRRQAEEAGWSAGLLYKARDAGGIEETEEGGYKFWALPTVTDANPYGPTMSEF